MAGGPPETSVDPDTTNSSSGDSTSTAGDSSSSGGESTSTGDEPCPDGTIVCEGTDKKVCDGLGGFKDEEACVGFCLGGANAGDYAEILLGQNAGGNSGDPAMSIAVATEQFRTQYLVHAPTNYETSFANVVAPAGAVVTVDGQPIANFTPIGASGFSVARISLSNAGDGNHLFTGDMKFGVSIYGYGQYTSYWYPGGLDLNTIPQ